MKRPWHVWLVFAVCVAGAAAAMAWLTRQALEADYLRRVAEADAELEQRVSLALWRMDSELAPIIAEEVIRPPSAFRPLDNGTVKPPQYVLLQFEALNQGFWRSPQIGSWKSYVPELNELSEAVNLTRLLTELPDIPLHSAAYVERNPWADKNPFKFFEGSKANMPVQDPAPPTKQQSTKQSQAAKAADFEQRGKRYESVAQQSLSNYQQRQLEQEADSVSRPDQPAQDQQKERVGASRPLWIGDRLLLVRRVAVEGESRVQGSLLDWPSLKSRLLSEATDLVPNAELVPVHGDAAGDPGRLLAGLPVRLVVHEQTSAGSVGPTLRWALWIGWGAVLLAAAAAAALLHGVMTLSERRAAFVSSVTHELRTPLTTFRMYAEMLARGMVPDAERRQEYFNTLEREAVRLTHLVENVLSYARLERGRKPQAIERVTPRQLFDRVGPRLEQRARTAEMQCEISLTPGSEDHEFSTDLNAVEQILFNLVDNAAKYAREAVDRRIQVIANRGGNWLVFTVQDHGPGIAPRRWSQRMPAFGKSAEESAETAPGVGLGLALCQRLARQLGGRLEIGTTPGGGATVMLVLPAG